MKGVTALGLAAAVATAAMLVPLVQRQHERIDAPAVPDITGRIAPQARTEAALPSPAETAAAPSPAGAAVTPLAPPAADTAVAERDPRDVEAALVRSALDFYRKGDLAGGDAEAARATDEASRLLLGWAAIRLAPRLVGFDRISGFIAAAPDWPQQTWLRRRAEEALVAERQPDSVVSAFFATRAPVTPGGKLMLAKVMRQNGREREAAELVASSWRTDQFGQEMEARFLAAFPDAVTPADHRKRTALFLLNEEWSAAQRSAARAGTDMQALVKAYIAASQGASNAKKLVDAVPKSAQSEPVLVLAIAEGLRKQKKGAEAAKLLAPLPRDIGATVDPEPWWNERRALVRNLLDAGEPKLAYDVAKNYPLDSAAVAVDAEFHAGWIALRFLNDAKAASNHFAEAARLATTPISIARAAYWQGRAAEAAGQPPAPFFERAAAFPTTYYGQLAKTRIDARDYTVRRVLKTESAPLERVAAVRAIELLYRADAADLAQPLFSDLAQKLDSVSDLDALAEVAAARGDARALLTVGKTALQRGFPLDNHAFPLLGVPEVEPPGGAERSLVFAIARQESAFDPRVVSSAGARGLMQLMPATAKATADRAGLAYDLDRLTGDAAYNAILGATHLGDLVDAWKGSYLLTVASYNAGPGNVKKWIAAYGDPRLPGVDPVDWVERIPFNETRNYVQRVLENLQVYRSRLGQQTHVLLDRDLKRGVAAEETVSR